MQSQDYFERLLRKVAESVARIVGLAKAGDSAKAEEELDAAWSSLGLRRGDAQRLNDTTLRLLLGAKAPLAAELFEAHAQLEEARGGTAAAAELRDRAASLRP